MSCAFREEASIDTTISRSRLPSPRAATGHVFNRSGPLIAPSIIAQGYSVRSCPGIRQRPEIRRRGLTANSTSRRTPVKTARLSHVHPMVSPECRRLLYAMDHHDGGGEMGKMERPATHAVWTP